jgi:hypothetical protein
MPIHPCSIVRMEQDTISYDSLAARPLPKWLTDQRDGLNSVQIVPPEIREDRSLGISFAVTGSLILLTITIMTVYILRKNKNRK